MTRRKTSLAAVALLAALSLIGCGRLGGGTDELTIYSGRTKNLVGPLLDEFLAETGIGIAVRYGDSAELALLIAEEGAASPADVFYSQSPGATGFLAGQDLLAPLDAESLGLVDERFRNASGLWTGVTGRQRVLVYNADLVDPGQLPDSVLDLTDPQYEGMVAVAPQNGSFQDFVTAMRQIHGRDATLGWLEGLAANGARSYANNNAIVEAVSRGEVPMGLVNHYYNYRFLDENPSLPSVNHLFAGTDIGALLIPSTVSILASTDQRPEAERFVQFLLSRQAQEYFSEETFEYPLAADVSPAPDLPPLAALEVPAYDFDDLGGGLTETVELIRASGLEGQ